jgi:hypothetical protein
MVNSINGRNIHSLLFVNDKRTMFLFQSFSNFPLKRKYNTLRLDFISNKKNTFSLKVASKLCKNNMELIKVAYFKEKKQIRLK